MTAGPAAAPPDARVPEPAGSAWRGPPRGIRAPGLVSMPMDVPSGMVHALLPVHLTAGLGASAPAAPGHGLAAVTKPVVPPAPPIGWRIAARFIDRVGKGIRGAPRDALVADLAPEGRRGAAFGLRRSLGTLGALPGPLRAIGLTRACCWRGWPS